MAYPDGKYPAGLETTFVNTNKCRSFNVNATTVAAALTGQVCSEVLILNKSGQDLKVYDIAHMQDDNCLLISDGESITIRGVVNSNEIKIKTSSGSGTVYYRTQYYSNNPSR